MNPADDGLELVGGKWNNCFMGDIFAVGFWHSMVALRRLRCRSLVWAFEKGLRVQIPPTPTAFHVVSSFTE